jgi:hypothetical protein
LTKNVNDRRASLPKFVGGGLLQARETKQSSQETLYPSPPPFIDDDKYTDKQPKSTTVSLLVLGTGHTIRPYNIVYIYDAEKEESAAVFEL